MQKDKLPTRLNNNWCSEALMLMLKSSVGQPLIEMMAFASMVRPDNFMAT
jgi:hypothetical protein